jgi:basic membrane protein A
MAESGANPIVVMGFQNMETLTEVAPEYPNTRFVLIDAVVDAPNVRSVIFTEHEGSYLVGMLAAMASKTGTVSFVGGMDIPLISAFACGYAQGAKAVKPDVKVIVNYTGDTPAAWNDPVKGGEIAKAQMSQGSDVVFAAAGGTGLGVLQAAADGGVLSIGVDSNQNYLHSGKVLTSMLKLVDNAVYQAFKDGPELTTGVVLMNLAAGGVGYALDEHNASLVTDEMKAKAEEAKAAIIAGTIKVHDYRTDSTCPAF